MLRWTPHKATSVRPVASKWHSTMPHFSNLRPLIDIMMPRDRERARGLKCARRCSWAGNVAASSYAGLVLCIQSTLAGSNPAADRVTFLESWGHSACRGVLLLCRIYPGARSKWLRDGDEALGSGGWLDKHGAVAGCQAQHSLRLPIRLHHSDICRRYLHAHDAFLSGRSLSAKTDMANG